MSLRLTRKKNDSKQKMALSPRRQNEEGKENAITLNKADSDYTPPSVLQQQVSTLEQLMQRESWLAMMPNEPDLPPDNGDDENESVGSARSLKEELDGAAIDMPDMERELAQLQAELGILSAPFPPPSTSPPPTEVVGEGSSESSPSPIRHRIRRRVANASPGSLSSSESSNGVDVTSILRVNQARGNSQMPDTIERKTTSETAEETVHSKMDDETAAAAPSISSSSKTQEATLSSSSSEDDEDEENDEDAISTGILSLLTGNKKVSKMIRRKKVKPAESPPLMTKKEPGAEEKGVASRESPAYHSKRKVRQRGFKIGFDGEVIPLDDASMIDQSTTSTNRSSIVEESTDGVPEQAAEEPSSPPQSKKPRRILFASGGMPETGSGATMSVVEDAYV
eukprot:scaffold11272_cov81-Cylindrotheca_fusiformis.AAC.2